jgi:hypothetical protein
MFFSFLPILRRAPLAQLAMQDNRGLEGFD